MLGPIASIDTGRILENLRARLLDGSVLMLAAAALVLIAAYAR